MKRDPSNTPQAPTKADSPAGRPHPQGQPKDVAAIRASIRSFLSAKDSGGKIIGAVQCGVYAFYDYDGEPIYIGRRAATIAALARVISERKVTTSLRTTLLTQARRLERLAAQRLGDFAPDTEEIRDSIDAD